MGTTRHSRLLILGSGPAGYTAAVLRIKSKFVPGTGDGHRARRSVNDDYRG